MMLHIDDTFDIYDLRRIGSQGGGERFLYEPQIFNDDAIITFYHKGFVLPYYLEKTYTACPKFPSCYTPVAFMRLTFVAKPSEKAIDLNVGIDIKLK